MQALFRSLWLWAWLNTHAEVQDRPGTIHSWRSSWMSIIHLQKIKIMTTVQTNLDGEKVYPHQVKCAWCGKTFVRHYKTVKYCSDECRAHAIREQKAIYQRKRRKSINDGVLCSNESQYIGTGFLSQNRRESFDDEYMAVRKELKRLKIKHYY